MGEGNEGPDRLGMEVQYAWDWFSYHAGQRLTAFNFFLVLMGAVIVGYTQAVDDHVKALGMALGGFGAFVALAFWAMDIRNEELVNYGRVALDQLETRLGVAVRSAEATDTQRTRLKEAAGPVGRGLFKVVGARMFKHRTWLRLVIAVAGLLSLASLYYAYRDFPGTPKDSEQTIVCKNATSTPCWIVRPSAPESTSTP